MDGVYPTSEPVSSVSVDVLLLEKIVKHAKANAAVSDGRKSLKIDVHDTGMARLEYSLDDGRVVKFALGLVTS